MTTIDITGFDNEDVDRQFTLKTGNATSAVPFDLSDVQLQAQIRNQKNELVLNLSTGDDGGIVITDAPNGVFTIHIAQGALTYDPKQSLKYDLLMFVDGETRRLFGGNVKISAGVTIPA
jgi:hypothetical protein